MNTALYFFSGTGNSLSVAQSIKKNIERCEILPIIGCLKQKPIMVTAQRVGIIFPMHIMNVPRIVRQFIAELRFLNPEYVFVIVTGANPKFGNALSEVEKCLRHAKVKLNAGYFIQMMASHFPYLKTPKAKQPTNNIKKPVKRYCRLLKTFAS
ncbi:hypothetical protein E9993_13635 [Labilibacter sediminis]|nr:hypothetical protein E9993_13635 [Labilibacter sediminis]